MVKPKGTTVRIKGSPGLNDFFAEGLVDDHGPDGARDRVCGPMLEAVERVIAARAAAAAEAKGNGDASI